MYIFEILKDTNYQTSLFSIEEINELEQKVWVKDGKTGKVPVIQCIIRKKEIRLTAEEIIRQLYTARLINYYKYPESRIQFEHPIQQGASSKSRADIVIFDKERPNVEYIIVEIKKLY